MIATAIAASVLGVVPVAAQDGAATALAQQWLLEQQNDDGSFGRAGGLVTRDTAVAVRALVGRGVGGSRLEAALIHLEGAPEATTEVRARRVRALASAGRSVGELQASLLELRLDPSRGSGFGAVGAHDANLLDTALGIGALGEAEETHLLDLPPLVDHLRVHQNADGGWGYVPGDASDPWFTAEAALALASLERLAVAPEMLDGAAAFLASHQRADGGFGAPLETALTYRALVALGHDVSALPASPVESLLTAQRTDGSWEGDVFTTAQVLLALGGELPDLQVTELSASPDSVLPGGSVTLSAIVANRGPAAAAASELVVRDDDGRSLATVSVPVLEPGTRTTVEATVAADGGTDELLLTAVADARDAVEESSEGNNERTVRVTVAQEADLAVYGSDLSVAPERPAPGEPFTLRISVRNQGGTAVDAFSYRVGELVAGAETRILAQGTAGPAAPGGGALVEVPVTLPEGEHLLRVAVDREGVVAETDETNNVAEVGFFVTLDGLPDFAIASADLVASPEKPTVGEAVDLGLTVRNEGAAEGTAEVVLYDGDPSSGATALHRETLTVEAGGSGTVSATFTLGSESRLVTAVVDPAGVVAELSEINNQARRVLVDRPDLAIGRDNLALHPVEPLVGEAVLAVATVRNAGTAPSPEAAVELWDGDPEAGGTMVHRARVSPLPPGGNRAVELSWSAVGGLRSLVVVADPDGVVAELSEANNRTLREVAVPRSSGPDLVAEEVDPSGLSQDPATLTATGTVTVRVRNVGDAPAGTSVVRLFEDRDGDGRHRGVAEPELASAVVPGLAPGEAAAVTLPVDAILAFHRPLVWVEVDATAVVAERREENNRTALFGECRGTVPPASFDAVEEWWLPGVEVEAAPVVAQLSDDDGDGVIDSRDTPDVVFHTEDAEGRAITARSGLDGSELWTVRATPDNPVAGRIANLAAADLDGDGVAEVIGVRSDRRLVALTHRGALHWVSDQVESVGGRDWAGAPVVGDLDGDGAPEIAVGRSVLSNTGRLIAQGTANVGRNRNYYGPFGVPYLIDAPLSAIADVDLDGRAELVAGDTLYRLQGGALEVVWDRTVPDKLMVDGFVAVADLDADPESEIVYVSSNQIMILEHDGSVAAGRRLVQPFVPFGNRSFWAGPPSVGDLDGDGSPEIVVSASNELVAFRANLSVLWKVSTTEQSEMAGAALFDLDGDGAAEVLYQDQTDFRILDGATGQALYSRPNTSKTATEVPVVADVDGDGRAEILVPSNRSFGGDGATQGLHVLGHPSWAGARPVWSQHTFRGTDVLPDGTVPAAGTPSLLPGDRFRSNLVLPVPDRLLPNLTLGLPRVGRATGDGVPVTVRVGNGGLETVPPGVRVVLYDGDPSAGGALAGEGETAAPLRPGRWADVEVLWRAPGAAGLTAWAAIDPEGALPECDETDNRIGFVLEESVLPDLAVPAGGVGASGPLVEGQLVPVTVRIDNAGAAEAGPVSVRLVDGRPETGEPVGEAQVAPLVPGESTTVEIPWNTLGAGVGGHALHAVADAGEVLVETDEANNVGLLEVDLTAPAAADPAVASFAVEPARVEAGAEVVLRLELVNRGAQLADGLDVAFLINRAEVGRVATPAVLGPGERTVLELPVSTSGRQGLLEAAVRIDPDGRVAEVNEENNRAAAELRVDGPSLVLSAATDRLSYAPGETVAVTVTADNTGTETSSGALRVSIRDSAAAEIARLADAEPVTLPPGTTQVPFTWDTGQSLPGGYAVVAELSFADGETGELVPAARAETLFTVAREVELDARLYADRDLYPPTGTAVLTGRVRSDSANTILRDLSARVAVRDAAGAEVFAAARKIPVLYPGSDVPVEELWEVAGAAAGSYTVSLEVRDAAGLLLAYASEALAVEDSAETGAGITGDLVALPDLVGAGAPVRFDYRATNAGNADLPELALRVDLVRLADGTVADSTSVDRSLPVGGEITGSLGMPTIGLAPGDYLAALVATVSGTEVRLDRAAVTVGPGVSVFDSSAPEGDTGTGNLVFRVTLSEPSDAEVSVDYATTDGTAVAGEDYAATTGTLVFAPGETESTVPVETFGDLLEEADEVFLLTLSDPVGVLPGDLQALGALRDEEGCPSPNLLANGGAEEDGAPVPGWEGSVGGWLVRAADPTPLEGTAAFGFAGDAAGAELTQTVDLTPFASRIDAGTQRFLAEGFLHSGVPSEVGATPDTGRLVVEYLDAGGVALDAYDSGAVASPGAWRAVTDLRTPPAGTRAARVRLFASRNDGAALDVAFDRLGLRSVGTPVLSVADAEVLEGDTGSAPASFTVTLSCARSGPVRLDWVTEDGTATAGSDYQAASGTLTLAAGDTAGAIEVTVLGDAVDEPDETFGLAVSSPDEPVVLTPVPRATVRDDDGPAVLSVLDASATEGDGPDAPGEAVVPVHLSAVSGKRVTASWTTSAATTADPATVGEDYTEASGTVTFEPGETETTIRVALAGDRLNEPDETFGVRLESPVNAEIARAEATVTLLDDDPVGIRVGDVSVVEGDAGTSEARLPVTLSVPSVFEVSVSWATSDLDASAGADYRAASGTLTFAPGEIAAEAVVHVLGDTLREPVETFLVTLATPVNGTLDDPEAVGSIVDDDGILVSVDDVTVREAAGAEAVFRVRLNKATTVPVSATYSTVDATAAAGTDYTATGGTVEIPAGAAVAEVRVPLLDDGSYEPSETFRLVLTDPSGEAILLDPEGEATLLDDDGWSLNGDADDVAIPGCIVLTPDARYLRGAAWSKKKLDLDRSFDKTLSVSLGSSDAGGEGIYFALQNAGANALGYNRGHKGWGGIQPSIGFEVDTHSGSWSGGADHASIGLDGVESAGIGPTLLPSFDVEDGEEHELRVVWNSVTETFHVHFEGAEVLVYPRDVVNDLFGGASEVFWGMTGGTGYRHNLQYFCDPGGCVEGAESEVSVGPARVTEGDAGTVQAHFPVTLSCPAEHPVTVSWKTVDGTAVAGDDYRPGAGTVTFQPGETSEDVVVEVSGDRMAEGTETFYLDLSEPVGAAIRHARGTGTLVTDDIPVLVRRTVLSEADEGTYPVRLDVVVPEPPREPVRLSWSTVAGSATPGEDYVEASGTVDLSPTLTTGTVRVDLIGDRELEGDEVLELHFVSPPGSLVQDTVIPVTVLDDDECPGPNLVRNGGAEDPLVDGELPHWTEVVDDEWTRLDSHTPFEGSYWFHAGSGPEAELAQDVDLSGYAEAIDAGTVRFQLRAVVTTFDTTHEDASRLILEYRDAPGGRVLATYDSGEIRDQRYWQLLDDVRVPPAGTRSARVRLLSKRYNGVGNNGTFDDIVLRALDAPSIGVSAVRVQEGSSGEAPVSVPVTLGCARSHPVSVDYLTVDGTARSGEDYGAVTGTVLFAPGETRRSIDVPVFGDTAGEGDESFSVRLVNPSGAALGVDEAPVTIVDDESVLSVADRTVVEGDAEGNLATIPVTLDAAVDQPVTVRFATVDETAVAGADYVDTSGTLTFDPGQTEQAIQVRVLGDGTAEADETFAVVLSQPVNAVLGDARGTVTVVEDDIRIAIQDAEVTEGNTGSVEARFLVTLSNPASRRVTVDWQTVDDLAEAGADYRADDGRLYFDPGQTARAVYVEVYGDTEPENGETFFVRLSNPVNGELDDPDQPNGTGFIIDDDDCPSDDLVVNGGAEEERADGTIAGWDDVLGGQWSREGFGGPIEGGYLFYAGRAAEAELHQDLDVSAFAPFIDRGIQRFLLEGFVRGNYHDRHDPDLARIVVEYRDGPGGEVLATADTGEVQPPHHEWRHLSKLETAPPGTRSIRIRLIARIDPGTGADDSNDAKFDRITLRSLGTPVVYASPPEVTEGTSTTTSADFDLRLSCPADEPVTVSYATEDGTARAGQDYLERSGERILQPGETTATVSIPVVSDPNDEPDQVFTLHLASSANAPVIHPAVQATILDDDPLPFLVLEDVSVVEGTGDDTNEAVFRARLSVPSEKDVSFHYRTFDRSARQGYDFVRRSGQAVFAPFQQQLEIRVPIVADALSEGDEDFELFVYGTGNLILLDQEVIGTIVDDDAGATCDGPELLANGGGDQVLRLDGVTGWTEGRADGWRRRTDGPEPREGFAYLAAGSGSETELFQDVDLTPYAPWIDGGAQELRFEGFVRSASEELPDRARVVLEYRSADERVLGAYDSGWVESDSAWTALSDSRTLPAGARTARVRLLAERRSGETTDAYFDGLSLVAVGTPTLSVEDVYAQESAASGATARFRVRLSCPVDSVVTVSYATADGTAVEGADYHASSGTVTFEPGDLIHEIEVSLIDDGETDPDEHFELALRVSGDVATVTPTATAHIADDDGILLDLALCIDGSGSIDDEEFRLQVGGTAAAIEDGSVIPQNGTVRLSVFQFSQRSYFEVFPTVIDRTSVARLAEEVRNIPQRVGTTDIASCLEMASDFVTQAWPYSAKQVIDVSTDGHPSNGVDPTLETADRVLLRGVDVINAIGVGDDVSRTFLDRLVRPQPSGGSEGFVVVADGFAGYADAIAQKLRKESSPDLVVTKTDGLDTVMPGEPIEYTITVRNDGAGALASVVVDETLPAGVTDPVFTPSAGTIDPATGRWTGIVLDSGSSVSLTVAGSVSADASGMLVNRVTVSPPEGVTDLDPADNTASDRTVVDSPVGEPDLVATKSDALSLDADGDGVPSPGDAIAYTIDVTNAGGAPATGVVLTDLVPDHATVVAGSVETTVGAVVDESPLKVDLGELAAGAGATVTFRVAVDLPVPAGVDRISNQGTVTSTELPAVLTDDPDLGGDADPTVTMLTAAPELVAEKTDRLALDTDADGAVSPGDRVEYTVTVRNVGNTAATGVGLADPVPDHAALVPGSVTASQGTVDRETPTVVATLGEIAGGAAAEVRFLVAVDDPIPAGARELSNQGLVASAELPDVPTDDPEVDGPADPTVTPVVAAPELLVEKRDTLFEDVGGDGLVSPGDVLLYRITVRNTGNTPATAVTLTDAIPDHTVLEVGSVQISHGTLLTEDPVAIEIGQLDVGTDVVVTFRVRIVEPLPLDVLEVANRAEVESAELAPAFSDDPDTAAEDDPTRTEVFILPEVVVDDATVDEASGPAVFTVTLSESSNRPVRVPYATVDGPGSTATSPATGGVDYLPAVGTLTVAPGATEATVAVEVLDDALDELDETFTLALGEPEGGTLADGSGLGTIRDDDPPPFVSIGDATVTEGDPDDGAPAELVFPVTLTGPSGLGVAVDWATATAADGRPAEPGTDFTVSSGTLTLPPGSVSAPIHVAVTPDRIDELDEILRVVLSNPVAVVPADSEAAGTIRDDDATAVTVGDVRVEEGDEGTEDALVPIRLSLAADRKITVDYGTLPGTAQEVSDYLAVAGTLAFAALETEATVAVPVVGDRLLEALEETLTVELTDAGDGTSPVTIEDGAGVVTIVDDEECLGPNLLANPGAEEPVVEGELPGWDELFGDTWQRRFGDPEPAEGAASFAAGEVELGELAQDVSVRAYDVRIASAEGQRFVFTGKVRTFRESPPDTARIVVEYRDGTNSVVLDAFDSGEIASPDGWHEVVDERTAPTGTGWIRVRLIATRFTGPSNDAYFDALELRSVRTATLTVDDVTVYEGDAGTTTDAVFTVSLACPTDREVTVDYATADGPPDRGGVSGIDYRSIAGDLSFAPGETEMTVPVTVLGDDLHELHETFTLELAGHAPADRVALLDPTGTGLIINDDFCPRSPGFWKTHTELWPTDWLEIGGVEYGAEKLLGFLESKGGDATLHLARQLVATKLNLLVGSDPEILPVVADADAYLVAFPPGSNPKKDDKRVGNAIKDLLDAYNNSPCEETPVVPGSSGD